jgi:hypothetical protein
LLPPEAAAIQSDGSVIDTSTVPLSAVEQFAGAAPDRIRSTAAVPIAVSTASNFAFRTAALN